jgi:hypothetical protein
MPDPPAWWIETLGGNPNRANFWCGNPSLDSYLKEQAGQDLRRGCAAPFVLVSERGDTTIHGFYTLSSYGINVGERLLAILPGLVVVDRNLQG